MTEFILILIMLPPEAVETVWSSVAGFSPSISSTLLGDSIVLSISSFLKIYEKTNMQR